MKQGSTSTAYAWQLCYALLYYTVHSLLPTQSPCRLDVLAVEPDCVTPASASLLVQPRQQGGLFAETHVQ